MLEKRYFIAPSSQAIIDYGLQNCIELLAKSLDNVGVCASIYATFGAWVA
jgi:hypothetical protein